MGAIRRLLGVDPLAPPLEVVRKVGEVPQALLDRSVDHDARLDWSHLGSSFLIEEVSTGSQSARRTLLVAGDSAGAG
jgi:hypothetical protein